MFQFPVNPTVGQQVVAPNGFTYQFDGVKWFAIGGGGGGSNVFVGDTPPASPAIGDMWFNSTNLKLFVWYEGAWVVANPSGGGGAGGAGVTVSETAPTNPSIGALWWDSSIGRLFVWDGGTGNEWVSVPWGGLSDAPQDDQLYARQNGDWTAIPDQAVLFEALATAGMQVGGGMEANTEKGTTGTPVSVPGNAWVCDVWRFNVTGSGGSFNAQQVTPSSPPNAAMVSALGIGATSAYAPGASGYAVIQQIIERWRMAKLDWGSSRGVPMTVAFWLFSTVAGTGALAIYGPVTNRSYVVDVPVTGGGWQYFTTIIPPDIAGGAWVPAGPIVNLTQSGLYFRLGLGGPGLQAPSTGQWLSGNYVSSPNTTNLFAATSNNVHLSNVLFFPGSFNLSADDSWRVNRPVVQEEILARYFQSTRATTQFMATAAGQNVSSQFYLRATMRAIPTAIIADRPLEGNLSGAPTVLDLTNVGGRFAVQSAAAGMTFSANAAIYLDARLTS